MLTAKEQSLLDALEKQAAEHGIEVVTIEVTGAKKAPTIRVYIDCPQGIGFDELASSQAWINQIMDAADPFPGAYTLEVSSPGIDRPLRTLAHFERFVGETAVVQTASPIGGRSKWSGRIQSVDAGQVVLDVEGVAQAIDFGNVKRAHLKGTVGFNA
ncbi:MAG: ribosome maturation factor RimP [Eggerthellaceae bacterium]|jgi:ribosome maturation factor RimP|nr:ribosome maturation factor RimP [Eggerthellaceae bacterium]MDR2715549.1 ribosome maturation factor RimP [Coriobacteriaceae bacterium]